jgi:spoIIIJ-associated protein
MREAVMSDSEQGETMTVQDRPLDDTATPVGGASDPADPALEELVESSSAGGELVDGESGDAEAAEDGGAESGDAADSAAADSADAADPGDPGDAAQGDAAQGDAAQGDAAGGGKPSRSSRRGSVRDLEEEGEVAADYLEELLDIVDVDGDIDIDVENGRASLAIVAEGGSDRALRRLVGPNGEVLEALQELTRLAVQASTGERSRLMLDVAGHRANRRKVLTEKASRVCDEVKRTDEPVNLEPMTAFERKIVHDVVADAGLESESEGTDPNRYVVVLPMSSS